MNQTKITLSLHAVPKLDVARDALLGFGLFELLLVLALLALSLRYVFPDLAVVQRMSLTQTAAQLASFVNVAGLEALTRDVPVRLMLPDASGGAGLGQHGRFCLVTRVAGVSSMRWCLPSDTRLTWRGRFHHRAWLDFDPAGHLDGQQGHFLLCDKTGLKSCCRIWVSTFKPAHADCA